MECERLITIGTVKRLLPAAIRWVEEQEKRILSIGIRLSPEWQEIASEAGVQETGRIRLLRAPIITLPEDPELSVAALLAGIITPQTKALTLGYGSFIRSDCWGDIKVLAHQFAYVAAVERLGGLRKFLEQYLKDCAAYGHTAAPLEKEASRIAAKIAMKRQTMTVREEQIARPRGGAKLLRRKRRGFDVNKVFRWQERGARAAL